MPQPNVPGMMTRAELAELPGRIGVHVGKYRRRAVLGVPCVNGRPCDRNALERDIAEGKTPMSSSHLSTVAGPRRLQGGWRRLPGRARLSLPFGEV